MTTFGCGPLHRSQSRSSGHQNVHVTSPRHSLANYERPIPSTELAKHVQLVRTDRSNLSKGQEFGVYSPRNWRLADLGELAFLRAGLGWGGMPVEVVQQDISRGTLVKIVVEDAPRSFAMGMSAVYRTDTPPGTAGRWFINRLKEEPDLAGPKQGRHLAATTRKTSMSNPRLQPRGACCLRRSFS